jgi:hypothetical protein
MLVDLQIRFDEIGGVGLIGMPSQVSQPISYLDGEIYSIGQHETR